MKRVRIMSNPWGWSLRGIGHWLSCWARPISVHGVEITSTVPRVPVVGSWPLIWPRIYQRILKIGPFVFHAGRYAQAYIDAKPHYFTPDMLREIRYPHGRWQAWRTRRRLAEIDRLNRKLDAERAMREGCS